MLLVTKVLHPGPARLAKLGENYALPRSVPIPGLLGALCGGLIGVGLGIPVGQLFGMGRLTGAVFGACLGGFGGTMLVQWRPWRGEHLGKVGVTWLRARTQQRTLTCPGSGFPTVEDEETMGTACSICFLLVEAEEGEAELVPVHEWKRRLYWGMMPIRTPQTGIIRFVQGNVPAKRIR